MEAGLYMVGMLVSAAIWIAIVNEESRPFDLSDYATLAVMVAVWPLTWMVVIFLSSFYWYQERSKKSDEQ